MNPLKSRVSRPRSPQALRRGAALYIAVTGTTMVVSVLAMSAIAIVRIERKQAAAISTRLLARSHARSAVELGLQRINSDPSWRTAYSNVETTVPSLGGNSAGSVSWSVQDSDGDIENSDSVLRIKGIGRVGGAVQASSVAVQIGATPLRTQTGYNGSGMPNHDDPWYQYLEVSVPNGATGWTITTVEVYARSADVNETCNVRLYRPLANDTPSATVIDSADIPGNTVDGSWHWHSIAFSGSSWIAPVKASVWPLKQPLTTPLSLDTDTAARAIQPPPSIVRRLGLRLNTTRRFATGCMATTPPPTACSRFQGRGCGTRRSGGAVRASL